MAEIAALKKRRAYIKGSMTKLQNFIAAINITTTAEDIKVRLTNAERYRNDFEEIENKIIILDPIEELDNDFEDGYYKIIAGLNLALRSKGEPGISLNDTMIDNTMSGGHSDIKLPKISIPSFSGDYTEWQSFHDLFCSTIHDNPRLTPSQKLQYLKGTLKNEAAGLLKHFSITDANYIEALRKLRERYDRRKHIVNAFIKNFMFQPSVTTSNSANVRRLLDTSDEIIRGLKALGEDAESRDHWLIYILVSKLDEETSCLWAQTSADYDSPSLSQFFEFLTKRIDALESIKNQHKRPYQQASQNRQTIKSHVVSGPTQSCPLCATEFHRLFECIKFNNMSVEDRRDFLKKEGRCFNCLNNNHNVYSCKSKFRCRECNRKHHSLVHDSSSATKDSTSAAPHSNPNESKFVGCMTKTNYGCCLLPTALVNVTNEMNQNHLCRILLDSGSQGSFISENCAQRLQLKRNNAKFAVSGIGATTSGYTKGVVSLNVTPWNKAEPNFRIDAFVFPKLTVKQPPITTYIDLNYFKKYELADPDFYKAREVDIIIGSDMFFEIIADGKTMYNGITLQNTILGWVVAGGFTGNQSRQAITINFGSAEENMDSIDKTLRRFWEIESIEDTGNHMTQEEKFCERHFTETSVTTKDGQFQVRLPFKNSPTTLGSSFKPALQRLHSIERRFQGDLKFASMYKEFMAEYIQLGHMKVIPEDQAKHQGYYLPHHGVMKNSSSTTKLRVVFDGSCKTSSGTSLNECLAVGPTVQSSLYQILCRFRKYKIALTADVEKMYRQIRIAPEDTKYQRIIWRESPHTPFTTYELQTVTYGTSSAPYLATRALNEAANKYKQELPEAVHRIKTEMYVDDLMTGANTIEEAIQLKEQIHLILSSSGFYLRKWVSNNTTVLNHINTETNMVEIEETSNVKVLGLYWNPVLDCFQFKVNLDAQPTITKRGILSEASRLFDPLGWLTPVTVAVKILFQTLWTTKLGWDDQLPHELSTKWLKIRDKLPKIEYIKLERYLESYATSRIILHGFSDASKFAYSAVVYGQIFNLNGDSVIKLLSAKSKVAPIKQISIPRLELCGAVLVSRLLSTVKNALNANIIEMVAWTDSTIVLDWLSSHPSRWNTFVGNRTAEILTHMNRTQWRHVATQDNPADCASRGLEPEKINNLDLWWRGPKWLNRTEHWPNNSTVYPSTNEEMRKNILTIHTTQPNLLDELISRFSSFNKIIRILAYILRFINIKTHQQSHTSCLLSTFEIMKAQRLLLSHVQMKHFKTEIQILRSKTDVPVSSKLKSLKPFIDDSELLRVGGRLSNASITYNIKHPVILPANDTLVELLVKEHHIRYLHAGPSLMMATLRNKYWIIGCRNLVRKTIHTCLKCVRYDARPLNQIMGDLPVQRVELVRPFYKVGVDYAGPFPVHLIKGRGQKTYKGYMCIFVCLATKAVHIEFVSDLTTDAYIAALRRFVARRGVPKEILSDNGTNFIGARNHLNDLYKFLRQNINLFSNFFLTDYITFKFIPPSSPHFGGLWEAAVKSAKHHLKRVTNGHILTVEEITTLLVEVEAMLNSRPICVLSQEDGDHLTPGHFLIGRPIVQLPAEDLADVKISTLSRWQMLQKINRDIWKRWSLEYLTTLQQRTKWHKTQNNIKTGDIVIIKDNNTPPSKWLLGKVIELHPGPDNHIRVVTVKTSSGNMKRPIHKLCLLPIESTDSSRPGCLAPAQKNLKIKSN